VGYVAFAQFVVVLIVRVLLIGGTFVLVVHFIEDLCFTIVSVRSRWMQSTLGVQTRVVDQFAVVASGAFRVVAFLFARSLAFSGFGGGRAEFANLGSQIGASSLKVGRIEITPDAVLGAIAVFVIGMFAIRAFKRWLHDRYLPTTTLDPAMRSSVT